MRGKPGEQTAAIGAAHHLFDVVFRMRHHAEHIAALIEDAGDAVHRPVVIPVGIGNAVRPGIAEQDAAFAFELRHGLAIGDVVALAVRHRHADHLTGIVAAGERRIGALDLEIDVAADEFELRIAHQHARQQAGLAQNLEAVADAEHQPALGGEGAHRIHHRRTRGDGAAAQIVAVGETARHHHQVGARRQIVLGVPDHRRRAARHQLQRARHVALAIDPREDEDGGFHGTAIPAPRRGNSRSPYWPAACRPLPSAAPRPWPCRRRRSRRRTPCPAGRWRRHRRRASAARPRSPCPGDRARRISG